MEYTYFKVVKSRVSLCLLACGTLVPTQDLSASILVSACTYTRDTIIPSSTQCNSANLDGYIPITTPQYSSLQPLELELKLRGGVGHGMFQPKGFSRPDSWCKGFPFLPPKNTDDAIRYKDYKNYFEEKKMWSTERRRRAIVTYRFTPTSSEDTRLYYR